MSGVECGARFSRRSVCSRARSRQRTDERIEQGGVEGAHTCTRDEPSMRACVVAVARRRPPDRSLRAERATPGEARA